jgi:transposase, IS5 family
LGAILIKEKLGITDEETVEQIRETPHMQYMIGMEGYQDEEPFDPSMAGHNPSDCYSPMHPGWSISEGE